MWTTTPGCGGVPKATNTTGCELVRRDLLIDDEPIIDRPYADRRRAVETLHLPALVVTPSYPWVDAPALLAACEDTGMEGVMLKRRDSPYLPGKRTDAWRKVKCAAWAEHGRQRFLH